MSQPICYDGYCGLGGWSEGFLAEGYRCVGFDIEAHDYGSGGYPGELILRDMRQVHGSLMKDAACLVFSPPCQEPSYRAMPWKQAKALTPDEARMPSPEWWSKTESEMDITELAEWHEWKLEYPKPAPELFIELFSTCFRIQREASEAAGRYVPMVVENVRGAQRWVGRAKANFGSFYLWGDVGMVGNRVVCVVNGKLLGHGICPSKARKFNPDGTAHGTGSWFAIADSIERGANAEKFPGFRFDGSGGSFQSAGVKVASAQGRRTDPGKGARFTTRDCGDEATKVPGIKLSEAEPSEGYKTAGMNWSDQKLRGQDFTRVAAAQRYREGVKIGGSGDAYWREPLQAKRREATAIKNGKDWFGSGENCSEQRKHGSKSNSRKAASAMIAKIPFALSQYVARSFKPERA